MNQVQVKRNLATNKIKHFKTRPKERFDQGFNDNAAMTRNNDGKSLAKKNKGQAVNIKSPQKSPNTAEKNFLCL